MTGYTPEEHYADPDLGFKLVHPEDRHLPERSLRSPETRLLLRSVILSLWIVLTGSLAETGSLGIPERDHAATL